MSMADVTEAEYEDRIEKLQVELDAANHDNAELMKERADYVDGKKRLEGIIVRFKAGCKITGKGPVDKDCEMVSQLQAALNKANEEIGKVKAQRECLKLSNLAFRGDFKEQERHLKDYFDRLDKAKEENRRLTEKHGICEWTYNDTDDDFWDTTCGETYCFMEGGIKDNRVVFCHRCGRLVKEIIEGE